MTKLITLLAIAMYLYQPVRPPEPAVPFQYDPNMITSEIIEAIIVPVSGHVMSFERTVIEPDGQGVTISCDNPNVVIGTPIIEIDPDPNNIQLDPNDPNNTISGPGLLYTYQCYIYLYGKPGVEYAQFTAWDNDATEPKNDIRAMLFYRTNKPPVLK